MKKGLLIWNIVVTIVALVLILTACTSDSRVTDLQNQLMQQQVAIANLQNEVNSLKSVDSQITAQLQTQTNNLQDQLNQLIVIISNHIAQ